MILAGIDEAGLGPNLGPLTTAATAFRTPGGWDHASLWPRLAEAVAERPRRGETRLVVADSKLVHARGGIRALEIVVAAFLACLDAAGKPPGAFSRRSRPIPGDGGACPWLDGDVDPPPAPLPPGNAGAGLAGCLAGAGASLAAMRSALLHPEDMNRLLDSGLNKNAVLLGETGAHAADLLDRFPDEDIWLMVDKQGGRNDYLPFLSRLFPGRRLDAVVAGAGESTYRVRSGGGAGATISFMPKADRHSFAAALASMAAKYVRERAMREFNAWFCARLPGLRPTAGYPVDARRWLRETEAFLRGRGIAMEAVWRRK